MAATILDGRALAQELRTEIQAEVEQFTQTHGTPPRLAIVQVEGDAASDRYVSTILKQCKNTGIDARHEVLPADVAQSLINEKVAILSTDSAVHGILIQMPLPKPLSADEVVQHLDPRKDVDGVHPLNAGLLAQGRPTLVPNTPAGGMEILKRNKIEIEGKHVGIVGRSTVVGRPLFSLLLQAHATVTVCHTRTKDLGEILRTCDIVAVAAGKAGLVTGDMIREGATVIDFGINVLHDGSMVGDVDFASVAKKAGAITPVPGGTGPVTNSMLLRNVVIAANGLMSGTQGS